MTLEEFKNSLSQETPPPQISKVLQALWQDANGQWDIAHRLAQSVNDTTGAWVHAYLHRKEGDLYNASYWYSHANQTMPTISLEQEWEEISKALLFVYNEMILTV
ncbi:hypothetical protein THII_2818 [Thioploca ingrica]|uniref:Uncharacterized protein n=1 Tax=Thioploca ingrica TaxID=40754 RepID=A0A090ANT1_9GAMM|nr:hypothetical protein THII_2818 [Thioploca ingrica]